MPTQNLTPATHGEGKTDRWESRGLVAIVVAVFLASAAASFSHVHDWTMANVNPGTSDWFGWANAVISELVPIAVTLHMRRLKRRGVNPGKYPYVLLVAAVAFSIAAQLAVAKEGFTGAMLSVVPALAFLGMSKLLLSKTGPAVNLADQLAAALATADTACADTTRLTAELATLRADAATSAQLAADRHTAAQLADAGAGQARAELAAALATRTTVRNGRSPEQTAAEVAEIIGAAEQAGHGKPKQEHLASALNISARHLRRQLSLAAAAPAQRQMLGRVRPHTRPSTGTIRPPHADGG